MKLTLAFALSCLLLPHAFAADYLITFKSKKAFNQFHARWVLGDKEVLNDMYFSKVNAEYKMKDSLGNLGVAVVESNDKNFLQKVSAVNGIVVEKDSIASRPSEPKALRQALPVKTSSTFRTVVKSLEENVPTISNFLKRFIGWGQAAIHTKEAWSLGVKGKGVRIADIDASMDPTHPAFAGKIEAIEDLLGGLEERDISHGSQVSGVLLGAESNDGFYGIAPDAKLLFITVCGLSTCPQHLILQAFNWSLSKHVDIINMSLKTEDTPAMRAALDAAEVAGVVVVASSGNDADLGPDYEGVIGFPASYNTVISVGGLMPNMTRIFWSQWSPELSVVAPGAFIYTALAVDMGCDSFMDLQIDGVSTSLDIACYQNAGHAPAGLVGDVVYIGNGDASDFVGKDFTGKIVAVNGSLDIETVYENRGNSNPGALVNINGADGLSSYVIRDSQKQPFPIPMVNMKLTDGKKIIDSLNAGKVVKANLTVKFLDYGLTSGTSMSAPMVSATAALMLEANPNLTPAQVKSIIMSTAKSLEPVCDNRCGSGALDTFKAVKAAQDLL